MRSVQRQQQPRPTRTPRPSVSAAGAVRRALAAEGRPLPAQTRERMQRRFGEDFGDVRIHEGASAADAAASLGALAFASGSEIVFALGAFAPWSAAGERLLVHELAHVIQQRRGPIEGERLAGGLVVSREQDVAERQADASAAPASGAPAMAPAMGAAVPATGAAVPATGGEVPVQAFRLGKAIARPFTWGYGKVRRPRGPSRKEIEAEFASALRARQDAAEDEELEAYKRELAQAFAPTPRPSQDVSADDLVQPLPPAPQPVAPAPPVPQPAAPAPRAFQPWAGARGQGGRGQPALASARSRVDTSSLTVGEKLGGGALGTVYDVPEDQRFVFKVGSSAPEEAEKLRRMQLAKGTHPNVMVSHGQAVIQGRTGALLERIQGTSLTTAYKDLAEGLGSGSITIDEFYAAVQRLGHDVMAGLAHLHHEGPGVGGQGGIARAVLHADIKPDNIMVDTVNGRAVIVDVAGKHAFNAGKSKAEGKPFAKRTETFTPYWYGTVPWVSDAKVAQVGKFGEATYYKQDRLMFRGARALAYGGVDQHPLQADVQVASRVATEPYRSLPAELLAQLSADRFQMLQAFVRRFDVGEDAALVPSAAEALQLPYLRDLELADGSRLAEILRRAKGQG